MNIIERIKEYLDFKGISKYRFYQDTGFSNGFLDKNSNIGSDKCERIIYQYSDVNPEWLLTGCGSMIRIDQSQSAVEPSLAATDSLGGEAAAYYRMYKEEREENKKLTAKMFQMVEEISRLKRDNDFLIHQKGTGIPPVQDVEDAV